MKINNKSLNLFGLIFFVCVFSSFNSIKTDISPIDPAKYKLVEFLKNMSERFIGLDDIKDIFSNLEETSFKQALRKDYYLMTNGQRLDDKNISLSLIDLFNSGSLDDAIKNAKSSKKLDLSNLNINSLEGLSEILDNISSSIFEIDLSNNEIKFVPAINNIKLMSVRSLKLSNNNIEFFEPGVFVAYDSLTFLDLGQNEIKNIPADLFDNLIMLKKLDLSDNNLKDFDVLTFKKLANLKLLNLADNNIVELKPELFSNLVSLKELYLKNNKIINLKFIDELKKSNPRLKIGF